MVKPREANSTLKLIDEYCSYYRNLFPEVRSFEAFTHLHAGIISDIKRKTLPAIAEIMGLENAQGLHHFLTQSPSEAQALKSQVNFYFLLPRVTEEEYLFFGERSRFYQMAIAFTFGDRPRE